MIYIKPKNTGTSITKKSHKGSYTFSFNSSCIFYCVRSKCNGSYCSNEYCKNYDVSR